MNYFRYEKEQKDFSSHKNKQICNSLNLKMSSKMISAQRHSYLTPHAAKLIQYTLCTLQKRSCLHESARALSRSNCCIKQLKGEPIANNCLVTFSKGKHFEAYLGCEIALFRKIFLQFKQLYYRFLSESHLMSFFLSSFLLHVTLILLLHSMAYPQGCELFNTAASFAQHNAVTFT